MPKPHTPVTTDTPTCAHCGAPATLPERTYAHRDDERVPCCSYQCGLDWLETQASLDSLLTVPVPVLTHDQLLAMAREQQS